MGESLAMFQGLAEQEEITLISGRLDEALVPGLEPSLRRR